MEQKTLTSLQLVYRFMENVRNHDVIRKSGFNPFLISVKGIPFYIFIKNLTWAQLSTGSLDNWRIQLPQKKDFEEIKNSDVLFVLLGYDSVNHVYTTWNPYWCKQRLNVGKSVSLYSRFSLQKQVSRTKKITRFELQNGGDVICIPEKQIYQYIKDIKDYYPEETDYIPIGSSIQKKKNEEQNNVIFQNFVNVYNCHTFQKYLIREGIPYQWIELYIKQIELVYKYNFFNKYSDIFIAKENFKDYKDAIDVFVRSVYMKKKGISPYVLQAALNKYHDYCLEIHLEKESININSIPICNPSEPSRDYKNVEINKDTEIRSLMASGLITRRTYNVFFRYDIQTIEDLIKLYNDDDSRLLNLRSFGTKSLNEVKQVLKLLKNKDTISDNIIYEKEKDSNKETNNNVSYTLDEYGKLISLDNVIINKLTPYIKGVEYPDYQEMIALTKAYYPLKVTKNMTPADWMTLFNNTKWRKRKIKDDNKTDVVKDDNKKDDNKIDVKNIKKKKTFYNFSLDDSIFHNGTTIDNALTYVLDRLDPELVLLIDFNQQVISKEKFPELEDGTSHKQCLLRNGYYVSLQGSDNDKIRILKILSDEFALNIKIEPIEPTQYAISEDEKEDEGLKESEETKHAVIEKGAIETPAEETHQQHVPIIERALQIGDISPNGQVTIIDEDRLCYQVKSISKGAVGVRTISKALLKEFVDYYKSHPNASSMEARNALSGNSEIDKFEYGYNFTLAVMAKMVLEGGNITNEDRFHHYSERIANMRQAVYQGETIVAKPVLLLALIDAIDNGKITTNRFNISGWLEERYNYLMEFFSKGSKSSPTGIEKPFWHLESDGFWHLKYPGKQLEKSYTPSKAWMKSYIEFASFDENLWTLLQSKDWRLKLRDFIVKRKLNI